MSGRPWLGPLAAALTAAGLASTVLFAAPSGAPPAALAPPARTQPVAGWLPWAGPAAPAELGDFVWCEGDAGTGRCRGFNADDFAITEWARTALVEPFLAGEATPPATAVPAPSATVTATVVPTPRPSTTPEGPTPVPDRETPTPSGGGPGPLATVVCRSAEFREGVLTCAPAG